MLEWPETIYMKRMLFNATHPEELRVAIVDGQKLLDLDIESAVRAQKKGNIYKGRVTRVEPSLEAAFVEYGSARQGFLPLKEISRAYFQNFSASTPMAHVKIEDVIKEGQEFVVQVDKDERGTKGAALTTFVSLAGRYLVLMPNNPKGGGISRRISGNDRNALRDAMADLEIPSSHALIARTAGIGRTAEELQWDLDFLVQLWKGIEEAAGDRPAPFLIFQESNLIVRTLRDYLRGDITEILIDEPGIFERANKFMSQVMPNSSVKLKLYEDNIPLFSRFQIEHQIETAYSREVRLPSGGALVIDHTEAVVAIDVNSAKATKGGDIEETALQTNLEAVDEVARQLRIRDLGGLIVIDLIDMSASRNQRLVESRLNEALKADRARVQVGRISRFGLLEMSRQRLRSSISDSNYVACPRCEGTGSIRSVTSSALSLLRILEEEALKENTESIHAHLPIKTATYLLNEKRHEINQIESRLGTSIIIAPTIELDYPHFSIRRLKAEDMDELGNTPSHKIPFTKSEEVKDVIDAVYTPLETPSINLDDIDSGTHPTTPPEPVVAPTEGILSRIWSALRGDSSAEKKEEQPEVVEAKPAAPKRNNQQRDRNQNRNSGNRKPQGKGGQRPNNSRNRNPNQDRSNRDNSEATDNRDNNRAAKPQGGSQGQGQSQNRKPRSNRGRGNSNRNANNSQNPNAANTTESNPGNSNEPKSGNRQNKNTSNNTGNDNSQPRERGTTRTSWNRGGNRGRRNNNSDNAGNADNACNQARPERANAPAPDGNAKPVSASTEKKPETTES
jgi:ribonuclease E